MENRFAAQENRVLAALHHTCGARQKSYNSIFAKSVAIFFEVGNEIADHLADCGTRSGMEVEESTLNEGW